MTRSGPPGSELEIVESDEEEIVPPEAEGMAATTLLAAKTFHTRWTTACAPFARTTYPEVRQCLGYLDKVSINSTQES